jgi:hypothetical protein
MLITRTPTAIPAVVGPVRGRILDTRADYERLAEFSVGDRKQSEREVMAVVEMALDEVEASAPEIVLAERTAPAQEPSSQASEVVTTARKVVALEATSGSWLGVSIINPFGKVPFVGLPYIEAIGTACGYRESRLCDELTRPGTALLLATVEAVAYLNGSPQAPPPMSAWVLPNNRASHYMFDAVGFNHILAHEANCPQDVRLRGATTQLEPRLPMSVYLPLEASGRSNRPRAA